MVRIKVSLEELSLIVGALQEYNEKGTKDLIAMLESIYTKAAHK